VGSNPTATAQPFLELSERHPRGEALTFGQVESVRQAASRRVSWVRVAAQNSTARSLRPDGRTADYGVGAGAAGAGVGGVHGSGGRTGFPSGPRVANGVRSVKVSPTAMSTDASGR
jgi:hypothetical protein